MAKPNARGLRSQAGKKGGYNRNKNRGIKKNHKVLFKKKPFLCVFNCQTGGDVLQILQAAKTTKLQRVSPILNGSRLSLYGWSCIWLTDKIKN